MDGGRECDGVGGVQGGDSEDGGRGGDEEEDEGKEKVKEEKNEGEIPVLECCRRWMETVYERVNDIGMD